MFYMSHKAITVRDLYNTTIEGKQSLQIEATSNRVDYSSLFTYMLL